MSESHQILIYFKQIPEGRKCGVFDRLEENANHHRRPNFHNHHLRRWWWW
jgi:hypothetical protein